eukprot:gene41794-60361_t
MLRGGEVAGGSRSLDEYVQAHPDDGPAAAVAARVRAFLLSCGDGAPP